MKKIGMTTEERDARRLTDEVRECPKCSINRPIRQFSTKRDGKNKLHYLSAECNKCQYERKIRQFSGSLSEYNENQRHKKCFTITGRAAMLRNNCKQRAKQNNYDFDLTSEVLCEKLKKGVCEVTGINLVIDDSKYHPYSPSVDRIDSNKGYTKDNIQITCMIYNFCKNKFTDEQVRKFFNDIKNDIYKR